MFSSPSDPPAIRAYIASQRINSTISAYGICVPFGGAKIIAMGTVPGNQMPYAQMVALDNFLCAVDDADLSESKLEAILWRDVLRSRLENSRSRKALVEIGQSVKEAKEDPERWDEVSKRAAKVVFGFPTDAERKAELTFIEKQLVRTYLFRGPLLKGPLVPAEACLSLDISKASPFPHNSEYLLSRASFGES